MAVYWNMLLGGIYRNLKKNVIRLTIGANFFVMKQAQGRKLTDIMWASFITVLCTLDTRLVNSVWQGGLNLY